MRTILSILALLATIASSSPAAVNPATGIEIGSEMSVNEADAAILPQHAGGHSNTAGSEKESSSLGGVSSGFLNPIGIGSAGGYSPFISRFNTFPNFGGLFLGFSPFNYAPLIPYFNPGIIGSPFSAAVLNKAGVGILPLQSGGNSNIAASKIELSPPGSTYTITPGFGTFNSFNAFPNFGGLFPGSYPLNNALFSPFFTSQTIAPSISSESSNLDDTDKAKGQATLIHFNDPATNTQGNLATQVVVNPDGSITKTSTTTTVSENGNSISSSSSTSNVAAIARNFPF